MSFRVYVDALKVSNPVSFYEYDGDLTELCQENILKIYKTLNVTKSTIKSTLSETTSYNINDESTINDYIDTTFYIFFKISNLLQTECCEPSLNDKHILLTATDNLVAISICCNLQKKLPCYKELSQLSNSKDKDEIMTNYNRLTTSVTRFIELIHNEEMRDYILNMCFQPLITALYQINYCPLKKPELEPINKKIGGFIMTAELFDRFLTDRQYFTTALNNLSVLFPSKYVTATMLLMKTNYKSPNWFQRAVTANLTAITRDGKEGVKTIVVALLDNAADYDPNDTAKLWPVLNVFSKLFIEFWKTVDFRCNIALQTVQLLHFKDHFDNRIAPFELIVAKCFKELYFLDKDITKSIFLTTIFKPFENMLTLREDTIDITSDLMQAMRMTHNCFFGNKLDSVDLPIDLVSPFCICLFYIYSTTVQSKHAISLLARELLLKIMEIDEKRIAFLDAVLFSIGEPTNEVRMMPEQTQLSFANDKFLLSSSNSSKLDGRDYLLELLEDNADLLVKLFLYLLNCLSNREKYFTSNINADEFSTDTNPIVNNNIMRNLMIFKYLSNISENKFVQQHIRTNPSCVLTYLVDFLRHSINSKVHVNDDGDSETFQSFFTVIMIAQAIVDVNSHENLIHYRDLSGVMEDIRNETSNAELKKLVSGIIKDLTFRNSSKRPEKHDIELSEFDKAIKDVCDSLLPVRGHGLLTLTKLVEKKHPDVMERKQYILNIFQQNLKNEDTFIYLNAIAGLAAMANLFPGIVLATIAEEYADFDKREFENDTELRLKLGEVLLRVVKSLGEQAGNYKAVLLNTFLKTTKDDDNLIRASSLSNLGEICKVLGYKLGPIIIEVLECIRSVMTTDLAPEPRRAAVSVIRHLLSGLAGDGRMLTALPRGELQPIYRTLRELYASDADEITRLHAQLALEELSSNLREILTKPNLSLDHREAIHLLLTEK